MRSSLRHAVPMRAGIAAALLAAAPAHADPPCPGQVRPAEAELRQYLHCSGEAARRLLGPGEAEACVMAHTRVKLAFLPGMTPSAFGRLPPPQKAALNLIAHERFVAWSARNAAEIAGLRHRRRLETLSRRVRPCGARPSDLSLSFR